LSARLRHPGGVSSAPRIVDDGATPPTTTETRMTKTRGWIAVAAVSLALAGTATAGTPQQEQAFTDGYKKAWEGKNTKALNAFLYTKNADPKVLELYRMMMTDGMGGKITSIALEPLSDADRAKAEATRPGPDGKMLKLGLKPTRKLVIKTEQKSPGGTSTGTQSVFVAEHEGRFVIPVPVAAK